MSAKNDQGHGHGRVRDLVEARLGRRPQDKLEAAVVLEAWGGVRPPYALDAAGVVRGRHIGEMSTDDIAKLTAAARS